MKPAAHTLEVRDLTLVRGTRTLVDSLSFSLLPGQALILRGTNGSGKTSLLRVLAGLAVPDAGSINDRAGPDQPPTDQPPLAHPPIAPTAIGRLYLGHANALKDELTAEENLVTLLAFDGVEVDAPTLTQALTEVGLLSRRHLLARRLSQGQKRRIGLARLKLADRPLWLLDEPTNALDSEGVALFTRIVENHLAEGGMACIATHLALPLTAPVNELTLGVTT